jgi:glycine cleavage system H protein
MKFPAELKYTKSHEWARVEGNTVTLGITDHAQHELGNIVFLDVSKKIGEGVEKGQSIGTVESVKTLSDIYSPLSGKVLETNSSLTDSPETVNDDPYGAGWIVKIEASDLSELNDLLDAAKYQETLAEH